MYCTLQYYNFSNTCFHSFGFVSVASRWHVGDGNGRTKANVNLSFDSIIVNLAIS
jgi:hypothetical protein